MTTDAAVLVTRPAAEAEATRTALGRRGFTAIIEPLLLIRRLDDPVPVEGFDGVILTSLNAAEAIAARPDLRPLTRLPAIAVGRRTAAAAREAGFDEVAVASGEAETIAPLLAGRPPGRFLHVAGADRSADLAALLAPLGHEVVVAVVYEAAMIDRFSGPTLAAFAAGRIGAVLHYSARTAEAFITAARAAGIAPDAVFHACLSERVAATLRAGGAGRIAVAARRDEAALIDLIATEFGGTGERAMAETVAGGSRKGKGGARKAAATSAAMPDAAPQAASEPVPEPAPETVPAAERAPATEPQPEPATIVEPPRLDPANAPVATPQTRHAAPIGSLFVAAILGGVIGAGLLYAGQRGGVLPPPPIPADPALSDRLVAIESGLSAARAAAEQAAASIGPANDAARAAEQRANDAMQAVAEASANAQAAREAAERAASAPSQPVDLGPIEARLGVVEQRLDAKPAAGSGPALSVALLTLADAVTAGRPFAEEWQAAEAMTPGDPQLAVLSGLAEAGVPNAAMLADRFTALLPKLGPALAADPEEAPPAEEGLLGEVSRLASSLVTVRRIDSPDTLQPLNDIENALQRGDIAAALALFGGLPEPVQSVAADWRRDATQALAAGEAAVALRREALAALKQ